MLKTEEALRHSFRAKFEGIQVALTFRDVMILPGRAEVEPSEVDVRTRVTKNHALECSLRFVTDGHSDGE